MAAVRAVDVAAGYRIVFCVGVFCLGGFYAGILTRSIHEGFPSLVLSV